MSMVITAVSTAIEELHARYPLTQVTAEPDGQGGARVAVDSLPLGPSWRNDSTWVGFHLTFQYPDAQVYPHYVRGDLQHVSGVLRPGLQLLQDGWWDRRPVVQVSRTSRGWDASVDTAALKLERVMEWLNQQ